MPQFDVSFYFSQIFWLLLIFGGLYLAMAFFALPKVSFILSERQRRVASDLDAADTLNNSARKTLDNYQNELAHARDEAHRLVLDVENEEKKKLQKRLDLTLAHQEVSRKRAEQEIISQAENIDLRPIVVNATHRLLSKILARDIDESVVKTKIQALDSEAFVFRNERVS